MSLVQDQCVAMTCLMPLWFRTIGKRCNCERYRHSDVVSSHNGDVGSYFWDRVAFGKVSSQGSKLWSGLNAASSSTASRNGTFQFQLDPLQSYGRQVRSSVPLPPRPTWSAPLLLGARRRRCLFRQQENLNGVENNESAHQTELSAREIGRTHLAVSLQFLTTRLIPLPYWTACCAAHSRQCLSRDFGCGFRSLDFLWNVVLISGFKVPRVMNRPSADELRYPSTFPLSALKMISRATYLTLGRLLICSSLLK